MKLEVESEMTETVNPWDFEANLENELEFHRDTGGALSQPFLYLKVQGHLSWHLGYIREILTFLEIPRKRTNYYEWLSL